MIYLGYRRYYIVLGHSQMPIKVTFYNLNSRLSDIMIYSTTSLPAKNGWMTGIFTNPNQIISTASNAEIL
jgi:hypothetical protein